MLTAPLPLLSGEPDGPPPPGGSLGHNGMLPSDDAARTLVDIIARVVAIRKERLSIIICQMPSRHMQVAGHVGLDDKRACECITPVWLQYGRHNDII